MVRVVRAPDPVLRALLEGHPRVTLADSDHPGSAPLEFDQDGWRRRLWVGGHADAPGGLVELADNNLWVCADEVSIPSALGTLALLCFGPLVRAGLLVEAPTLQTNCGGAVGEAEAALLDAGWGEGLVLAQEVFDGDLGVFAAAGIAVVQNPEEASDLDDLYEEAYGRSFFVRRDDESEWDLHLVRGTPRAVYRLRIAPGEGTSLLTIQAMATRDGKCGAAQLVHAMNVMAGFEETLGTEAAESSASKS